MGRPVGGWGWEPRAHRVQRGGLRVEVLSGHSPLGLHASFSIRSNQPGQMKQVGDQEEAGTKLSRASGSRMLVGIERTRPISRASTKNPPQRQSYQGFRLDPKIRSN